jgi:hypothetical protein
VPANTLTGAPLSTDYATNDIGLPQEPTTPKKAPRVVSGPPKTPCPTAASNAFPHEAAPLDVPTDRRPAIGSYRWKKGGSETISGHKITVSGFEQRFIRNIQELGKSTNTQQVPGSAAQPGVVFSYETVQPDTSGNIVVTTYQVNTYATQQTQYVPPTNAQSVSGGDPERGLTIKRIEVVDKKGNTVSSFEPITGLLLLPLPVQQGLQFQSVAIDSKTGEEATFNATVLPRQRVDACGELLEGWEVKGDQTFSGATTRTEDLIVAPQLGGIVISDAIAQTNGTDGIDTVSTIGQSKPDPLPPQ